MEVLKKTEVALDSTDIDFKFLKQKLLKQLPQRDVKRVIKDYLIKYLQEAMNTKPLEDGILRKPIIYTALKHCSRRGIWLKCSISVYVVVNNRIIMLDYLISDVIYRKIDKKNGGVGIGGCGMDMGFALVNEMFCQISDTLGDDYKHGRWQSIWEHSWM